MDNIINILVVLSLVAASLLVLASFTRQRYANQAHRRLSRVSLVPGKQKAMEIALKFQHSLPRWMDILGWVQICLIACAVATIVLLTAFVDFERDLSIATYIEHLDSREMWTVFATLLVASLVLIMVSGKLFNRATGRRIVRSVLSSENFEDTILAGSPNNFKERIRELMLQRASMLQHREASGTRKAALELEKKLLGLIGGRIETLLKEFEGRPSRNGDPE